MTQNFPPNQPFPPQQGYQQGPPPGYQGPPPGYQPGPPQQQGYGQQGNYQPAPPNVPHVAPQGSPYPVLVSTMNDLPGYTAETVYGEVFGLTVRSRDFGSNFTAS
ncbi:MAG TPA: heavy metal-binding domain-containing protein, partial [Kribbella sp.]|nr:heavy metal-binding domain-containing protein [Kribbella sp.]